VANNIAILQQKKNEKFLMIEELTKKGFKDLAQYMTQTIASQSHTLREEIMMSVRTDMMTCMLDVEST
jgi:hypothetical protein